MIKNEHKQTGGVVPRLLITVGLAPTTKGRHTQSTLAGTGDHFGIYTQWD